MRLAVAPEPPTRCNPAKCPRTRKERRGGGSPVSSIPPPNAPTGTAGEILEHYEYRGQVMRVLLTAQDSQTIRDAFGRAKPNAEYANLYAAAVARR